MPTDCINYQESGYFTKIINDYLDEKTELKQFYNRFPKIENFKAQILEKSSNFPIENRAILVSELEKQYSNVATSNATSTNIKLLENTNTFTITTGHQLNLFTGPLYFLYKIVTTINLTKELKLKYPNYDFVPIYWMATEDHDFEEINYFTFKNKKIAWNKESFGAVGRLSTDGLKDVFTLFEKQLGIGTNAQFIKNLFKETYLKHSNLASATRYLANELFENEGLVIIDADNIELKKLFAPFVKKELLNQTSFKNVTETNKKLEEYKIQVNPREINLFYIQDNLRERIVFEKEVYKINNTKLEFSETEILAELENFPERFSPNVILRPLYQEIILPNLCYIGGGGELAYWLQLKSNFDANNVTLPILLLRNSVVLATTKQIEKADKLDLSWNDLFLNQQELFTVKTKEFSEFKIDFSEEKELLQTQFKKLHAIADKTDKSFSGAVKAQEKKQIKGLENLEKRLLKAEKRVHTEALEKIILLQNELFPNQGLQERKANFSEFYLEYGLKFIDKLLKELQPLEQEFKVVVL